jgi:alcohol dehydrogenase class IV
MTPFGIQGPAQILFGWGEAARAPGLIAKLGARGVLVHGAGADRAAWLLRALADTGCAVKGLTCATEPTLPMLDAALLQSRDHKPDWIVGLGGGAVLDMAKALAALIPAPGGVMDHLEVVGRALPLKAQPLPFVAIPTTAGTGAEATKNAVIGLPEHHRKVSLRDDRMLARLAIVDPALTVGCPWPVTLASGLDAVVQVIEPYVSVKATPYTDALARPAITKGLRALMRLRAGEDADARTDLAWVSLCGGLALANAGLGAVHGLAGPIGGISPAAHGAVCGALIGPVLAMNHARATGDARDRLDEVCALIAEVFGGAAADAPHSLARWAGSAGLQGLVAQGLEPADHLAVAQAAQGASSMKGNPVALSTQDLLTILAAA